MHTYDVRILLPGKGSFHVSVRGYTPTDARTLVAAQYPGCQILAVTKVT